MVGLIIFILFHFLLKKIFFFGHTMRHMGSTFQTMDRTHAPEVEVWATKEVPNLHFTSEESLAQGH